MQNLIITGLLFTISFIANAQILSDDDLATVNVDNIIATEQMKLDSDNAFGSNFVTVGSDTACTFKVGNTKIQDAINAGNTEIRIAEGTYAENVVIDDRNVKLLGGYETCTDANNNNISGHYATISPSNGSGQSGIQITGNSTRNYVVLRRLNINNGQYFGGLSIRYADVGLILNSVHIQHNNGDYGGGLSIIDGNTDIYANNLYISQNEANVYGGGLFCRGNSNNIIIERQGNLIVGMQNNKATYGGGAYISDGCRFTSYIGGATYAGSWGIASGIVGNNATEHGGGIYATSGAQVFLNGNQYCGELNNEMFCYGNNSDSVQFLGNIADSDLNDTGYGGGIYATGNDTSVYANNILLDRNDAVKGGGAFVTDNALFQTQTSYNNGDNGQTNHCWKKGRCNRIIGNKAVYSSGNAIGGAFYAELGGQLMVARSHIEFNRADIGAAFYIKQSDLRLEGSYVTQNGSDDNDGYDDKWPIRITNSSTARIEYSTIADNHATQASIYNYVSSVNIYSSIIHEQNAVPAIQKGNPLPSDEDCLIVNDLSGLSGTRSIEADPEFIDRANNNYHLNPVYSLAVDYCDGANAQHTSQDTDRENRGWDDYIATNTYGPYDVGADESYGNDVIFEDEFE